MLSAYLRSAWHHFIILTSNLAMPWSHLDGCQKNWLMWGTGNCGHQIFFGVKWVLCMCQIPQNLTYIAGKALIWSKLTVTAGLSPLNHVFSDLAANEGYRSSTNSASKRQFRWVKHQAQPNPGIMGYVVSVNEVRCAISLRLYVVWTHAKWRFGKSCGKSKSVGISSRNTYWFQQ